VICRLLLHFAVCVAQLTLQVLSTGTGVLKQARNVFPDRECTGSVCRAAAASFSTVAVLLLSASHIHLPPSHVQSTPYNLQSPHLPLRLLFLPVSGRSVAHWVSRNVRTYFQTSRIFMPLKNRNIGDPN